MRLSMRFSKGKQNTVAGFLFFTFFLLPFSFGADSAFKVVVKSAEIVVAGGSAKIYVTVTNDDEKSHIYTISLLSSRYTWFSLKDSAFIIPPHSSKSTVVLFHPPESAGESIYRCKIIVTRDDGERVVKFAAIKVVQKKELVISDLSLSCTLCDPGEKVAAYIELSNTAPRRRVEVVFKFDGIVKRSKIIIGELSKRSIKTSFQLDKLQPPGEYTVTAEVYENGKLIARRMAKFKVKRIKNVKIEKSVNSDLFFKRVTITIKNLGNAKEVVYVNASSSGMWYIYQGPKCEKKNGMYVWEVELSPEESKVIKYEEFFWLPVALVAAALLGVLFFLLLYPRGIKIKKYVIQKKPVKEGETISVSIEIKAGKNLRGIRVIDFVPPSFELVKSFETIKPIRKEREEGIELVWKLRNMRAGEERVLHYKLRARISVIGSMKLPKAKVICTIGKRKVEKSSNAPHVKGSE